MTTSSIRVSPLSQSTTTQSRLSEVVEGRSDLKLEDKGGVKEDAKITDLWGRVDGASASDQRATPILPEQELGSQTMSPLMFGEVKVG